MEECRPSLFWGFRYGPENLTCGAHDGSKPAHIGEMNQRKALSRNPEAGALLLEHHFLFWDSLVP